MVIKLRQLLSLMLRISPRISLKLIILDLTAYLIVIIVLAVYVIDVTDVPELLLSSLYLTVINVINIYQHCFIPANIVFAHDHIASPRSPQTTFRQLVL